MAGQNELQVSESREELLHDIRAAKERLQGQAGQLTVKQCMVNHPYLSLGTAFFSGVLAGESHEIRVELARKVIEVIGSEIKGHSK